MKRTITSLTTLLVLGVSVTAGCASNNVTTETAAPVAKERIYASALTEEKPGTVPVLIKRDNRAALITRAIGVFVDGINIAKIDNGEKLIVNLEPGRYLFGVGSDYDAEVPAREIAVSVTEQHKSILRVYTDIVPLMGLTFQITESSN